MILLLTGFLLFFLGGVVSIFIKGNSKGIALIFCALAAQFIILPISFNVITEGLNLESTLQFSEPFGKILFRLDPLAAFFSIIISFGSLLAAIYSMGYMKQYTSTKYSLSTYFFFLGMLSSTMLMVVIVQNMLLFLVVWELMSLSSFFLVTFENDKKEVIKSGIYYLVAMQIGVSCLIAAFAWASNISGSLDFDSLRITFQSRKDVSIIIFILFFIGFGVKAGFVPMHTWLPKAHPAAPSGISAIMS